MGLARFKLKNGTSVRINPIFVAAIYEIDKAESQIQFAGDAFMLEVQGGVDECEHVLALALGED